MPVREILLLGNPKLYESAEAVKKEELSLLDSIVADLQDTLMEFRKKYHAGRAIAAPQIGVMKRMIYMNINDEVTVFINPQLSFMDKEMMEVWDDCMSFPNLLVKVQRHKRCKIVFKDRTWHDQELELKGDLSELLQHEYDHLEGILAVERAIDKRSFLLKKG